jgi:hypothetical protein
MPMPFTNRDYPNKVFEDKEELRVCSSVRDRIRDEIDKGIKKISVIVEVASVIKKDSPLLKALLELIRKKAEKKDG